MLSWPQHDGRRRKTIAEKGNCGMCHGGGRGRHSRRLSSWRVIWPVLGAGRGPQGRWECVSPVTMSPDFDEDTPYHDVSRCWNGRGNKSRERIPTAIWGLRSRFLDVPTPTIPEDAISEPWAATALNGTPGTPTVRIQQETETCAPAIRQLLLPSVDTPQGSCAATFGLCIGAKHRPGYFEVHVILIRQYWCQRPGPWARLRLVLSPPTRLRSPVFRSLRSLDHQSHHPHRR